MTSTPAPLDPLDALDLLTGRYDEFVASIDATATLARRVLAALELDDGPAPTLEAFRLRAQLRAEIRGHVTEFLNMTGARC